eukprot:s613_g10.t1
MVFQWSEGEPRQTNSRLASLAAAGVSLAAVGAATSRSRVQVKSATQAAEPATPPPFQPSEQLGATAPLGFFDPLGFTAAGDEKGFRKLREPGNYGDPFGVQMYNDEMRMKELNNGRMAMISVLGIFAAECATGKDAMQQFGLPALGGGRFASSSSRTSFTGKTSLRANAQQSVMRRAEAVVSEDVPPPPFQPSEQLGATAPLGFFDPLGFTAAGDEKGFRKLRVSEMTIACGRAAQSMLMKAPVWHEAVAMMASIGLVGQHFLKFPGFENSPAGFSIMGRGEGVLGFFAIFLVSGLLELAWREDPSGEKEPGNYGDPFGVQMYNDEMRMKELNNGKDAIEQVELLGPRHRLTPWKAKELMAKMGKWMQSWICQQTLGADNDIVSDCEGPMPGDSAETLDDLRQECAVLRQRVVGLEAENTELQALVKEWRMWYAQCYKPQIEFLDAEIARMVTMAPTCRRLASTAVQEPEPGTERGVMPKMSTPPMVWAYHDYLPMELAKLPASSVEVFSQPRRTRKERANTMARELSSPDDRRLRLLCLTWNVGATRPLSSESLEAVLDEEPSPDLCIIGFQETCQLSARRLLADGTEWEQWQKWAEKSVKDAKEQPQRFAALRSFGRSSSPKFGELGSLSDQMQIPNDSNVPPDRASKDKER